MYEIPYRENFWLFQIGIDPEIDILVTVILLEWKSWIEVTKTAAPTSKILHCKLLWKKANKIETRARKLYCRCSSLYHKSMEKFHLKTGENEKFYLQFLFTFVNDNV